MLKVKNCNRNIKCILKTEHIFNEIWDYFIENFNFALQQVRTFSR